MAVNLDAKLGPPGRPLLRLASKAAGLAATPRPAPPRQPARPDPLAILAAAAKPEKPAEQPKETSPLAIQRPSPARAESAPMPPSNGCGRHFRPSSATRLTLSRSAPQERSATPPLGAHSWSAIRYALERRSGSYPYLRALAGTLSVRCDLHGQPIEDVSEEQRNRARQMLDANKGP
jgi:hypothetical protein